MKKLSSKILTDKVINSLSEEAENLFYHMIVAADGYGRLIDSIEVIQVTCYPQRVISKRTLSRRVKELQDAGLLTKTVIEGRPLLEINGYEHFIILRSDRKRTSIIGDTNGITKGQIDLDRPSLGVKEFLKYWGVTWSNKVGNNNYYPFSYGKEGKIVKELLRTISLEDLKNYATKFLESDDQFIRNTGWTIGAFKMSVARFITNKEEISWKEKFLQKDSKNYPLTSAYQTQAVSGKGV